MLADYLELLGCLRFERERLGGRANNVKDGAVVKTSKRMNVVVWRCRRF